MLAETENFVGWPRTSRAPSTSTSSRRSRRAVGDAAVPDHPDRTRPRRPGTNWSPTIWFPEGIEVVRLTTRADEDPPLYFNQNESLVHLRVTIRDGQAQPTLYVHHALADGHHMYSLIEELLSYYTDLVTSRERSGWPTARAGVHRTILADRGIQKGPLVGHRAVHARDSPTTCRRRVAPSPATNRRSR